MTTKGEGSWDGRAMGKLEWTRKKCGVELQPARSSLGRVQQLSVRNWGVGRVLIGPPQLPGTGGVCGHTRCGVAAAGAPTLNYRPQGQRYSHPFYPSGCSSGNGSSDQSQLRVIRPLNLVIHFGAPSNPVDTESAYLPAAGSRRSKLNANRNQNYHAVSGITVIGLSISQSFFPSKLPRLPFQLGRCSLSPPHIPSSCVLFYFSGFLFSSRWSSLRNHTG